MPRKLFLVLLISIAAYTSFAQKIKEPKAWNKEWEESYAPFRIAGNLYYVGTKDLACYLITTSKGSILINTGLQSSYNQIKNSITALGFSIADIKILLTTQAHYDHMGAMAKLKKETRAQFWVNKKDADAAADGGKTDYALGGDLPAYKPVKANRLLKNNDTISLGGMQLVMLHHPGHTKGSSSFLFNVKDEHKTFKVLIANMPSIVTDSAFNRIPAYPTIAADYAYTLSAMKNIQFDIWLASHASQFNMHDKRKPTDAYNPAAFKDQAGYLNAIAELQKDYEEKLKQQ